MTVVIHHDERLVTPVFEFSNLFIFAAIATSICVYLGTKGGKIQFVKQLFCGFQKDGITADIMKKR